MEPPKSDRRQAKKQPAKKLAGETTPNHDANQIAGKWMFGGGRELREWGIRRFEFDAATARVLLGERMRVRSPRSIVDPDESPEGI